MTVEATGIVETCVFPLGFTYTAGPGGPCMSVTPNEGPVSGGNTVTITSLGPCVYFPGLVTVEFGGNPALLVTILSAVSLICTVPAAMQPGPVDVLVLSRDSQGAPCTCLLPDGYTYR